MTTAEATLERDPWAALLGQVPGLSRVELVGKGVGTGTGFQDVSGSGRSYPWLTTPQQLELRSGSPQDKPTGTGADALHVVGLDRNFAEIAEDTTLNGQTAVPTVRTDWFRVNDAWVLGTKQNVAAVAIRRLAPNTGDTIANVSRGDSRRFGSVLTVPLGRRLLVYGWRWAASGADIQVRFRYRVNLGPWIVRLGPTFGPPEFDGRALALPLVFEEKTDLIWEINTTIEQTFELFAFMEVL